MHSTDLLHETLPDWAAPCLTLLAELHSLSSDRTRKRAERSKLAATCYGRLQDLLRESYTPKVNEEQLNASEFRRWFSEAVLLWRYLAHTGSDPFVDTVGAQTLSKFPLDLPMDDRAAAVVTQAVRRAFCKSDLELERLQTHVQHLTSNLRLKRRIAVALVDYVHANGYLSPEGRVAFFEEFYEDLPWRPGDVDFAITAANLFFFIPRHKNGLEVADWDDRSEDERAAVAAFFQALDRSNLAETDRFPAFGLYQPQCLNDALIEALSQTLGERPTVLRATLSTMFSIIPTRLRAQYLVHDTWGHTWQEAVSEFEWEYELLRYVENPVDLESSRFTSDSALLESFAQHGDRTLLNPEAFWSALRAEFSARHRVGLSMVLSEVFADFMESKYSRLRPEQALPTSSLIPVQSLKLDLTIGDLERQLKRVFRPFLALVNDPAEHARWVKQLEDRGRPAAGLDQAVAAALTLVRQRLSAHLDLSLDPANTGATVFRRTLLQVARVMSELERGLNWADPRQHEATTAAPNWRIPETCPDLLVIACAHFYEQDREVNFWNLHHFARCDFKTASRHLQQAIAENPEMA